MSLLLIHNSADVLAIDPFFSKHDFTAYHNTKQVFFSCNYRHRRRHYRHRSSVVEVYVS